MGDTILHRLHENGRIRPNAPAYFEKMGAAWVPTSWKTYLEEVRQAAKALLALGVPAGSNIAILGFNRPEWTILDLAAMLIGGAPAGIYTTNSAAECKYIIENAETPLILVENEMQWRKIAGIRDEVDCLQHMVTMRGTAVDDPHTLTWEAFLARGDETGDAVIDQHLDSLEMEQLATLIYTSGTTGPPKGVMLSHKNLSRTSQNAVNLLGLTSHDKSISYLPLSHIAEQMFTIHGSITAGYQVYFAQYPPQEHLNDNFKEARPTLVFGVPRIWEKFYGGVAANLAQATGVKAKIAAWAQDVGRQVTALKSRGKSPSGLLALQYKLADRLIFSKVKDALGLDQAKFMISGAAPINPEILEGFGALDLIVMEIYGQSEGSGPTTTNSPGKTKFGTVGLPWPESEVVLADDGEILLKGPNVFLGYYKNPAATADDLQDGWLHSGDLGKFDEEGYLSIIGRKKEIIITSGGKNIAPKNIEAALQNIPLVSQTVIIGEQRRFITALITLDPEAARGFAAEHGIEGSALHDHPLLRERLQREIDEKVNSQFARVEQVRDFRILPRDFTVEDGELTPTLKIKRRVISEHFAPEIESMYAD